ncbi:hypothetical protein ACHAPJ_012055 [Fusarium lateritium]
MKSLQSIILLLMYPTVALSLSKRTRESFEPKGEYGSEGYTTYAKPVRVSGPYNCTKDQSRQNGNRSGYCNLDRYKMGITVNSTVNVSVSDITTILEAVRDAADPEEVEHVNLNKTVVMPFSIPYETTPNGTWGWYTFEAKQHCWEGQLGDCSDNDEDKDDTMVKVCGWVFLNGGNNESARTYDGRISFVESAKVEGQEDRPFPEYEDAVEKAKESAESSEEDSGATQHVAISSVFTYVLWSGLASLFLYM